MSTTLVNPVSFILSLIQIRERRPLRGGERQSGYSCVSFANYSQFTDNVLLHMRFSLRRRNIAVLREHFACCCGQHFWVKLEKVGERVAHIYNKVREPAGSLLFHVKQKSMNLPVVSCKAAKYLMFHVKQL